MRSIRTFFHDCDLAHRWLVRATIGIRNERSVGKRYGWMLAGDWTVGQARYILASPAYRRFVSSHAAAVTGQAIGIDGRSTPGVFY